MESFKHHKTECAFLAYWVLHIYFLKQNEIQETVKNFKRSCPVFVFWTSSGPTFRHGISKKSSPGISVNSLNIGYFFLKIFTIKAKTRSLKVRLASCFCQTTKIWKGKTRWDPISPLASVETGIYLVTRKLKKQSFFGS